MITNEQLVKEIQCSNDPEQKQSLIISLWDNVKHFIELKAFDFMKVNELHDCYDDLMQEAFISLTEAVYHYDPARNRTFISFYFSYYVKSYRGAFNKAVAGNVTTQSLNDPFLNALSLDIAKDHTSNDDNAIKIIDIIEDQEAQTAINNIDNQSFWNNVNLLLSDSFKKALSEEQQKIMFAVLNDGMTIKDIYTNDILGGGFSYDHYATLYYSACRKIKDHLTRGNQLKRSKEVGIFDFVYKVQRRNYYSNTINNYRNTLTSCVERVAIDHIDFGKTY